MAQEYEVFICYETRTGLSYARHLKESLKKMKRTSFVAAEDLKAGDPEEDVIRETAIKNCKYFVVVVTFLALESEEVIKEINLAGKYDKKIIPCKYIKVDRISLSKLPIIIDRKLQQIDFETKEDLANIVIDAINRIEKSLISISIESCQSADIYVDGVSDDRYMGVQKDAFKLLRFFYDEQINKHNEVIETQDVMKSIKWNKDRINSAYNYLKDKQWLETVQNVIGNIQGVQRFRVRLTSQGIDIVENLT